MTTTEDNVVVSTKPSSVAVSSDAWPTNDDDALLLSGADAFEENSDDATLAAIHRALSPPANHAHSHAHNNDLPPGNPVSPQFYDSSTPSAQAAISEGKNADEQNGAGGGNLPHRTSGVARDVMPVYGGGDGSAMYDISDGLRSFAHRREQTGPRVLEGPRMLDSHHVHLTHGKLRHLIGACALRCCYTGVCMDAKLCLELGFLSNKSSFG